jgi:hypothetical protein
MKIKVLLLKKKKKKKRKNKFTILEYYHLFLHALLDLHMEAIMLVMLQDHLV